MNGSYFAAARKGAISASALRRFVSNTLAEAALCRGAARPILRK
jgi:hypothetical protein